MNGTYLKQEETTIFQYLYRAYYIILYYDQQMHNYFINYHTPIFILVLMFCLLFPFVLMMKHFDVSCFDAHSLLNQMTELLFSNFNLVIL
jgi:hypothetical protein